MSSARLEELYYDYTYNLFLARTLIAHLPSLTDRQKVIRWIHKLSTSNQTMKQMRLRNDFLYYLVLNIQAGELRCPFTQVPPDGNIEGFTKLLPAGAERLRSNQRNGPVRSRQKDDRQEGGAFMVGKPVPRCGAFCYLAICSNPSK